MRESIKEYLKAVWQRWWWLVAGVIGGGLTIPTLAGINLSVSWIVGLGVLFICFGVAQFLAYHDIRQKNKDLINQTKTQDWEYAKKKRIELIKAERYPTEVLSILRKMEQKLIALTEKAKKRKVTKEQLDELVRYLPPVLLNIQAVQGYKLEIFYLWRFQSYMEVNGIGLDKVKRGDPEWVTLTTGLDDIKKDIPDQELKEHIRDYVMALDGVYSWNLWQHYIDKTHTQPPKELATAIQAKFFRQDLLEHTFTRIKKRIDELLSGEEPKWALK
jgi:hypothetical protein